MSNEIFWKEKETYTKKMWDELFKVQMELVDDKNVFQCSRVDFDFSEYYFKLRLESTRMGEIRSIYFSCRTKVILRTAISWILENTDFYEVTALVKDRAYVTFRSQKDIDWYFDMYYSN